MPRSYRRLAFQVEREDVDLLIAELWARGTSGVEQPEDPTGPALVAYFPCEVELGNAEWGDWGGRLLASEQVPEEDWLERYREGVEPFELGVGFVVNVREPREPREPLSGNGGARKLLRLPARTAFGSGSHASTRLALEILETLDLAGKRVLDVGSGSGILSFAATHLGARQVVGIESDLESALVGGENRRLNALYPSFVAGRVGALRPPHRFDIALVNVLPERIEADLEAIRELLEVGGAAVFSGILTESMPRVAERLDRLGFAVGDPRACEEWSAVIARRVRA